MSRKAKIIIRIICLIILAIAIVLLVKHYNKVQEQREHEKLMQQSIEEISYINKNSDMYGLKLMASPLEDFDAWGPNLLKNGKKTVGSYYCWEFNGKYCINEVAIESWGGNVLGLHVGETYDKAMELMKERGYILKKEYEGRGENTRYVYKKAYVKIVFEVTPDNEIIEIFTKIYDPYNTQMWIA